MISKRPKPTDSTHRNTATACFKFHHGHALSLDKTTLVFFPVFSDDTSDMIVEELKRIDLKDKLDAYYKNGMFKAKNGEILEMLSEGVILGGLGKRSGFHPEKVQALFRTLAAKVIRWSSVEIQILITRKFKETVDRYHQSYKNTLAEQIAEFKPKEAHIAPKSSFTNVKNKSDDISEEEDIEHDYRGALNINEMIVMIISSMMVGADSMTLLKKKSKSQESVPVGILCDSLDEKELKLSIAKGAATGGAVNEARRIASLPGNYMNPQTLEAHAKEIAKKHKLKVKVIQKNELERLGLNGIVAVGKGSALPPRMILLEYTPPVRKSYNGRVALVGKGITFDTGGISLKPPAEMHEMKYDMCGAAIALHSIALAAEKRLPVEVVALLGVAENMPDASAQKPGDVYTAYNGKTIEVQNTDAEGRLVLADLLTYACRHYTPSYMIDFATLTGSCVIALGHEAAALFTSSSEFYRRMERASFASTERIWRMPHWNIYSKELESGIADLRNVTGRAAGSITAMRFLSEFVEGDVRWAHIDIAGTAYRSKPAGAFPKGATGWGVRLVQTFLEELAFPPPKEDKE